MILKCSSRLRSSQGQGYLRLRPLKVKAIQVPGQSRSSQGHSQQGQGHSGIKWLCVSISIPKQVVGFHLNAYRYLVMSV